MERLAGFGPEHYTAAGHCPINKIFGTILTHGLAETREKLFLLSIETAPQEQFPCRGGWSCRACAGLKRCVVEVSHSKVFLVPRFSPVGFKKLLTERNSCQWGGWRGTWKTSRWSSNRASKGKLLSSCKTAFLLAHFIALWKHLSGNNLWFSCFHCCRRKVELYDTET